jgi:hypothetical protein
MPSATDPDQRHGRKSASKRFNGHKAEVSVEIDSQVITHAEVLAGNAADGSQALAHVEQVEANTGVPVAMTVGDCAYGSGAIRAEFDQADRELVAKVPQEAVRQDLYPKSAFGIDLEAGSVTCPAGETVQTAKVHQDGSRVYTFGARCAGCALRDACTYSARGRTVSLHPQEALLQAARAVQESQTGQALLRARQAVEHRLARLGQLGIGQARYVGRRKTRFQLLIAATIANLRRTWNWVGEQAKGAVVAEGRSQGTPRGQRALWGTRNRRWWAQRRPDGANGVWKRLRIAVARHRPHGRLAPASTL